ncbi:MAG TPA: YciI family protein [Bryobacteraceae bacterium]|nr:YciI family protein [Bryobacteraceae bacterium]
MNWALPLCLLLALPALHAEQYCFGFLNAAPNRADLPKDQLDQIQSAHLAHMTKMALQGHLLAAGPIPTPGGPRGIVIYRCQSIDQAVAWTSQDPAVVNKRLLIDMHLWNAPAGLGEPLSTALKSDPAAKYTMVQLPLIILRKTPKAAAGIPESALKSHFDFYTRLNAQGKVRIAGPFIDSPSIVGVFVLSAMTLDEAKTLMAADPLVAAGYATLEPHMWFVTGESIPKPPTAAP